MQRSTRTHRILELARRRDEAARQIEAYRAQYPGGLTEYQLQELDRAGEYLADLDREIAAS